jgi:hypothetical protein
LALTERQPRAYEDVEEDVVRAFGGTAGIRAGDAGSPSP